MPKLKPANPAQPPRDVRDERLAVNAADLERFDVTTLLRLTQCNGVSRIDWKAVVDMRDGDPRSEEVAVECVGPLLDAALMIDMIRDLDRRAGEKRLTRAYVRRRGWSRISGPTPLTVPDGRGGYALNPELFPPHVTDGQLGALAPPSRRVKLGRS